MRKSELMRYFYWILLVIAGISFILGILVVSKTYNIITALITMGAGVGTYIGIFIIYWYYSFKTTTSVNYLYAGLLLALLPAGLFSWAYATGNLLTLLEPSVPSTPPIIVGVNATAQVYIAQIPVQVTQFCECKLYHTFNSSDWSNWTAVNIGGNYVGTDFYHDGWLNCDLFTYNLSKFAQTDEQGRGVVFWLKTQAWWKLTAWMKGTYTPPSWWKYASLNMTEGGKAISQVIETNETVLSWTRIGSGINLVYILAIPYTNYFKIENALTYDRWNSSDNAYANKSIANWQISIKNPTNETYRGYPAVYDWQTHRWYGRWLIASSNDFQNIYRTYNDSFGNTKVLWFNITQGWSYKGAVLNNSIIADRTYDTALLLDKFNYDLSFKADIQIYNGSAGISWYLGGGFENDIHIIKAL